MWRVYDSTSRDWLGSLVVEAPGAMRSSAMHTLFGMYGFLAPTLRDATQARVRERVAALRAGDALHSTSQLFIIAA